MEILKTEHGSKMVILRKSRSKVEIILPMGMSGTEYQKFRDENEKTINKFKK